jgi:hypothetical protein
MQQIILWILVVYAGLVTWICIAQFLRCVNLEVIVNRTFNTLHAISEVIESTGEVLNNDRLRVAFQNDDEVGSFFEGIQRIQEELNNLKLQEDAEEDWRE